MRSIPQNPRSAHRAHPGAAGGRQSRPGGGRTEAAAGTPIPRTRGCSRWRAGWRWPRDDRAAARKAFEQALAANPRDNGALTGLVGLDIEAGRKAEARQRVEARLALDAERPVRAGDGGARLRGPGARRQGRGGVAGGGRGRPRTTSRRSAALCRIYYRQNRLGAGAGGGREDGAAAAESAAPQTLAGFLLEAQGRSAKPRPATSGPSQLDPRAAAAANNLAWIYASSGQNLDRALQLAQVAKASLPDVARGQRHAGLGATTRRA